MTRESTSVDTRMRWVDVARGLGIILVVYGHALRGHFPAGGGGGWLGLQDRIIYSFHMPLFFVLAGLFLWSGIARDRKRFLSSRWWQVIYPYLFWSLTTAVIEIAMSRFVNTPLHPSAILLIPIVPIEQYWFLSTLLVIQLIVAALYPRRWLLWPAALLALAAFGVFGGKLLAIPGMLNVVFTMNNLVFVVFGIWFADRFMALAKSPSSGLALGLAGWAALAALFVFGHPLEGTSFAAVPLGIAGSIGAIGLSVAMAPYGLSVALAMLGKASLAIYVMHSIVSAGARIALKLVGVAPDTILSIAAVTVIGVIAPFVAWRLANHWGLARVLGLGAAEKKTARRDVTAVQHA